jgi:hypothetical protein
MSPMNARFPATLLVAAALALGGCSGDASSGPEDGGPATGVSSSPRTAAPSTQPGDETSPTSSRTPIPRDPIHVPPGVRLTAEGAHRAIGQRATVAWRPEQGVVGAITVRVTGLKKVSMKKFHNFRLGGRTRRSTPYFVTGTAYNAGRTNLAGYAVPLYLLDKPGTLIQASSFRTKFPACPSAAFPKKFAHGAKTAFCLVYFVPHRGKATTVTFRPSEHFVGIIWRGSGKTPGS